MTIGTRRIGTHAIAGAPLTISVQTIEAPTLGDVSTINPVSFETTVDVPIPTLGDVLTLNAPNVFQFVGLNLPSIGGGPVAGGLWIANAPEPEPTPTPGEPIPAATTLPDPRIRLHVVTEADPATVLSTLVDSKKRKWQDPVGVAGTGSAVLENDDPLLAQATYGRLLRFELDDRQVFLASIEQRNAVVLAQSEEVDEVTEVGGRGTLALWEDGVVYPEAGAGGKPYAEQRLMNWTSSDFDDAGWSIIKLGQTIAGLQSQDAGIAAGFPDGDAHVIWAHSAGGGGAGAGGAAVGYAYFRQEFTVATAGWHRLFLSADDGIEVIIDGVRLFGEARLWFHLETKWVDLFLSAGTHQIAARGENLDTGDPSTNSAWILVSLMTIDEDGNLGAVVVHTDENWVGVAYPPKPPGMNVGTVIRVLLEEAQARGALLGWTLAFDDTKDSNGQPWLDDPELAFEIGLDLYSVLQQIAETYVEIDTAPAQLILYAYADGFGQTTGVTYEEGESILALAHEGQG